MPILTKVSGALREAGVEFCTDAKSLFSASLDHARYSFRILSHMQTALTMFRKF